MAKKKQASRSRVFTPEFKARIAKRILSGESVSAIHEEVGIRRSVLYRWRDAYEQEGIAGLNRPPGRPKGQQEHRPAAAKSRKAIRAEQPATLRRIANLEQQFTTVSEDLEIIKQMLDELFGTRPKRNRSGR